MPQNTPDAPVFDSGSPLNRRCKLESCGVVFTPGRSWQDFCKAEHRDTWNRNHYCGHHRIISECAEVGCEAHALFLKVRMFEQRFQQCRCGRWFERRQKGMVHCSKECRYKAKHEAEKRRRDLLQSGGAQPAV